jgi:hypothetical protein
MFAPVTRLTIEAVISVAGFYAVLALITERFGAFSTYLALGTIIIFTFK